MAESNKCSKCGKVIPQGEGLSTKKGIICSECAKKKNVKTWGTIGACLVAIAAIACFIVFNSNKVDSFEGVGNINDNISAENVEVRSFDISKAMAISSPTSVGDAIDDIVLFKTKVQNTVNELSGDDNQIILPSINVLFGLNSYALSESATALINEFAKVYCQTNKESMITVDGYTCDLGSDRINNELSLNRANAVKQVLVSSGVPDQKISIKGYGKTLYGQLGLNGREANRRVNIGIK